MNVTVQGAEEDIEKAENLVIRSKELVLTVEKDLNEVNNVRKKVKEHFEKLNILQCTHQYMRVVQHIEYLKYIMFVVLLANCIVCLIILVKIYRERLVKKMMNSV